MSYLRSIEDAFARLSANPVAFLLYIFISALIICEWGTITGPLERIEASLEKYIKKHEGDVDYKFKLAKFVYQLVKFLIKYKSDFILVGFTSLPLLLEFSLQSLIAGVFIVVFIHYGDLNLIEAFLVLNGFLFYTLVDNAYYKLTTGILILLFLLYRWEAFT